MTSKMVQIITTTKFKVTVYLTFKEAYDKYNFCLDFYFCCLLYNLLLININIVFTKPRQLTGFSSPRRSL